MTKVIFLQTDLGKLFCYVLKILPVRYDLVLDVLILLLQPCHVFLASKEGKI
jgi:hypothetical protein